MKTAKRVQLGAVADLCLGKMLDQKKNRGELLPYLANVNVRWGEFVLDDLRTMRFEPHELDRYGLKYGDIVMCEGGEPGRCAIWKNQIPGMMIQKAIHRIRPKDILDNRFLFYSLLNIGQSKKFDQYFTGATIKHLPGEKLAMVEVDIPPLPTQRRIASILSAYDDLIENNTRRIAILEEMARRIYEEWFVHFRFPGYEQAKMVESELGLIPEGWGLKCIGDVCSRLQSGGTPSRSKDAYWTAGTVDWYKTKELWDGFLFDAEEQITELAVNDKKTRVFEAGTILMAIYGSPTVGRLGITTRRCACNQAALGFELNPDRITKWFLVHTLSSLRREFNNKAQGAAQQNISKEKVAETGFILPERSVIDRFETIIEPIWGMLLNLQRKNTNLRATRDLLLPKLISGELDVSHLPETEAVAA